jgi:hypothetical protein
MPLAIFGAAYVAKPPRAAAPVTQAVGDVKRPSRVNGDVVVISFFSSS